MGWRAGFLGPAYLGGGPFSARVARRFHCQSAGVHIKGKRAGFGPHAQKANSAIVGRTDPAHGPEIIRVIRNNNKKTQSWTGPPKRLPRGLWSNSAPATTAPHVSTQSTTETRRSSTTYVVSLLNSLGRKQEMTQHIHSARLFARQESSDCSPSCQLPEPQAQQY